MAFLKRLLPTVVTMAVGIVTLLLYFVPNLLTGQAAALIYIRGYWVEVAVVIAAFAMLLGLLNLLYVHAARLTRRQPGWGVSFFTIVAAVLVLTISILDAAVAWPNLAQGVAGPHISAVYKYGLYPLQSSFTALLAFLLAFAAFRTLRLRRGLNALLFLGAALIVLAAQVVPNLGIMTGLRDWLVNVWATAGLRGVLLGIALGTVATMMRILLGLERPTGS